MLGGRPPAGPANASWDCRLAGCWLCRHGNWLEQPRPPSACDLMKATKQELGCGKGGGKVVVCSSCRRVPSRHGCSPQSSVFDALKGTTLRLRLNSNCTSLRPSNRWWSCSFIACLSELFERFLACVRNHKVVTLKYGCCSVSQPSLGEGAGLQPGRVTSSSRGQHRITHTQHTPVWIWALGDNWSITGHMVSAVKPQSGHVDWKNCWGAVMGSTVEQILCYCS